VSTNLGSHSISYNIVKSRLCHLHSIEPTGFFSSYTPTGEDEDDSSLSMLNYLETGNEAPSLAYK
jgi:hypothetical protein